MNTGGMTLCDLAPDAQRCVVAASTVDGMLGLRSTCRTFRALCDERLVFCSWRRTQNETHRLFYVIVMRPLLLLVAFVVLMTAL